MLSQSTFLYHASHPQQAKFLTKNFLKFKGWIRNILEVLIRIRINHDGSKNTVEKDEEFPCVLLDCWRAGEASCPCEGCSILSEAGQGVGTNVLEAGQGVGMNVSEAGQGVGMNVSETAG
jgi:hypothetical protein